MKVFLNERPVELDEGATVAGAVARWKPDADLFIVNGFPAEPETRLHSGDSLVLIRKGEPPSPEEMEALMVSRHSPGIHRLLKQAGVGIAGCGGLGSTVALALARVGTGFLRIVDFDVVEPSNLNRQQYYVDQIGKPKVHALAENLARVNPAVRIDPREVRITPDLVETLFADVDVVVEAFDRSQEKAMLAEAMIRRFPGKPFVMGLGMAGYGGNALLRTRKLGDLYVCGDELSEAGPGFGLMAPRVMAVAAMMANQVLEILLGEDPQISRAGRIDGGVS